MSFLWIWHLSLISADSKTARRRKCRTYSIAGWRINPFYVSILNSYIFIHGGFPIDMSSSKSYCSRPGAYQNLRRNKTGDSRPLGLNSIFQWSEEQKSVLQWSWCSSSSSCFISCFPHPSHPHCPPYPHVQLSLASSSMSSYNWSGIAESGHMTGQLVLTSKRQRLSSKWHPCMCHPNRFL